MLASYVGRCNAITAATNCEQAANFVTTTIAKGGSNTGSEKEDASADSSASTS